MALISDGWYCAAFAEEVSDRPFARRIVGNPILLVRDLSGQIRATDDRCPHRFAPLHKGVRFEDSIECPYHGLRFDLATGACVFNPHGDGQIPDNGRACIKQYPVVERGEVVWVWPGNSELADPADIPDLELYPPGNQGRLYGSLNMDVDYRLVLDNLLDLSHAAYLHQGTLSPSRAKRETKSKIGKTGVEVNTVMRKIQVPSSQALYFKGDRGDYYSGMTWTAPGTLKQRLAITEVDADPDAGSVTRNAHLITPETEKSTHYFWLHSRNQAADDTKVDDNTRDIISNAFLTEDEPMIAACQDYMESQELSSLNPLFLPTDLPGTRCRHIIERLLSKEEHQEPT